MTRPVVSAQGLSKAFGAKRVLDGITVTAEAGDVIGVLGKNGAGKTTLLEILLGFGPPSEGSAQLLGETSMRLSEAAKARIGFVPQQDELVGILTGERQLSLTASFHRRWDSALIARLAADWEVPLDRRIQHLSVGERQKLSLLLALGHRPDLLVLDEPVASLDPIARRRFITELVDGAPGAPRTVLFSSHIVSDLERVANKVWILKDGRLAWAGDLDALKDSVVRLHIRGRRALPPELKVPNALSSRVNGAQATVSAASWDGSTAGPLAARLDADLEVENLSLEEIFVELHR
ncbi:MAG TPA: ABC transporter ATP-binding protein [Gammaproteobacteria bacterium]|nr:ABC transporter ATP-binding protein [Gammaproteobacteria bacterium]